MESPVHKRLFQRRNETLDWRKLAAVDVDKVAREIDVDAIQDNILNVTYCHIEHELGYTNLDPNFIKLFRLAQLTIEYLLHCQDYLQQCMEDKNLNIKQLNERIQESIAEQENVKNELLQRNAVYKNLKKEFQKSKKMIGDYQLMIRAGASGLHKCICCEKSFVSETYLRSHMERRHPEEAKKLYGSYYSTLQQSQPQQQQNAFSPTFRDIELQNELNEIKSRLKSTEDQLRQERESFSMSRVEENEKNEEMLEGIRVQHDLWKTNEQSVMKQEMENFKEMMMSELRQTQKEKEVLEKNFQELAEAKGKRKSNLGDLLDVDDNNVTYDELYQKMNVMEVSVKRQISDLQDQHNKQEASRKMIFNKKLSQEIVKRDKLQEQRNEDKKFYEQQIELLKKKLSEHDELIEKNKVSYARDMVDAPVQKRPPEPPPRPVEPPLNISIETVEKILPEKDAITLWVSINQTLVQQSYRVSRQAASVKGEWKDVFSFAGLLQPIGDFRKPIYVYSCAGSPYWRQYISSSEYPPRPNYKHDFTFFVTPTKLLGAIKVFVLDAGSGTVVRSMISRDDHVENWKAKGLSFYVMKPGPSIANVSRSGTFNSDVFDGVSDVDDDVSVSSFTGTDVVKQNLADDIKRSRENLLVDDDENENDNTKGEMKAEEFEEDQEEEEHNIESEEEEESENKQSERSFDEVDGDSDGNTEEEKFFGTSSGSFLSATLPEKGEYYPYPDNPLAVARFDHSKEMLVGQRKEIQDILDDHLEKRGVDPDEIRMSNKMFASKMKHHEKEALLKERNFPGFSKYRQKLRIALDDFTALEWAKRTKKKTVKKFKKVAGAIKGAAKFVRRDGGENSGGGCENSPRQSGEIYSKDLDEASSTEREYTLTRYERPLSDTENLHRRGRHDNDDNHEYQMEHEEEEEDVSESWNVSGEEEEDEEEEEVPRVNMQHSSPIRYAQREEPYKPKLRSPKGEKVKELARSLEASLTGRDRKKKLAGAVDLHNTMETDDDDDDDDNEVEARMNKPKRSVSFRDTAQYNDDDNIDVGVDDEDDDSDFSLTSASGSGSRRKENEEVKTDSYGPSVSKFGKQKPTSSSTPNIKSTRPSSGGSRSNNGEQQQQQSTVVTQFSLEDFDDDDSF